ncbi:N-acetylglucosamine kinase [Pseudalkalibacillus hwajinpoensis]|uniref:ATPase BadF/BadG/BcrA/BcrD type domain-containing protein n=1 Tax=Guptibacillus hwajinpoensis TaxID=208199 RepID=A0A4U1MJZ1_9BACL|nr:BadF/BadG/BcrA/BcrD ATPase family protein [Pseudalkalibacillus hwajinpoensis]TKD70885.1 hypothetical protein FBF83_09755 [Pseudalkalibacillus hwajinpoensis]
MQSNKKYYIGIDGGGTKTVGLLCDDDGVIVAKSTAGSTNLKSREEVDVRSAIQHVVMELTDGLQDRVLEGIFVSTAGGDREEDQVRWKKWIKETLPFFTGYIEVKNDAYGALASGTYTTEGKVLIAGTGSIAYSISGDETRRVGGWGYLFGDDGSGYDIGRQALRMVAAMHDGTEKRDEVFVTEVLSFLQLTSASEMITAIYEDPYPRMKIASIAKVVILLAEQKNLPAMMIMNKAMEQLNELTKAIEGDDDKLVVCGGLFQSEFFRRSFAEMRNERKLMCEVCYPLLSPAAGACICALISRGRAITDQQKENLLSSHGS